MWFPKVSVVLLELINIEDRASYIDFLAFAEAFFLVVIPGHMRRKNRMHCLIEGESSNLAKLLTISSRIIDRL